MFSIIWLSSLLLFRFHYTFSSYRTPDHLRPSDRLTRSSPLVTRYRWVTPPNRGVPWVLGPSSRFHHHIILLFHEDCHFASLDLWFSPYYSPVFNPPAVLAILHHHLSPLLSVLDQLVFASNTSSTSTSSLIIYPNLPVSFHGTRFQYLPRPILPAVPRPSRLPGGSVILSIAPLMGLSTGPFHCCC
jgi:hypothetical protein